MDSLFRKIIVTSLTTMSLALVSMTSTTFAQETTVAPPANATSAEGPSATGTSDGSSPAKHWKHHHGKHSLFIGMCVERTLAAQNPPVVIQLGQKLTKEQRKANWAIIKPVKEACRAQFKASKTKG